jgi:hypothetical protein
LEWWGKIKTRGKLTITTFSTQLVGGDVSLIDLGKAVGMADGKAIILEKEAVRISFE